MARAQVIQTGRQPGKVKSGNCRHTGASLVPRRFGDFHLRGEGVIRPDCPTVTTDMKIRFSAGEARNLLVGVGAVYLSWWVSAPLAVAFGKITHAMGIHYYGDFEGGVVLPIVMALPYAIVAAFVGASVVWIVESERPLGWTLVPTFLYTVSGLFHLARWARPPTPLERVGDTIRVLLPAVACVVGGIVAAKWRAASRGSRPTVLPPPTASV
jgi:hypothetical protein